LKKSASSTTTAPTTGGGVVGGAVVGGGVVGGAGGAVGAGAGGAVGAGAGGAVGAGAGGAVGAGAGGAVGGAGGCVGGAGGCVGGAGGDVGGAGTVGSAPVRALSVVRLQPANDRTAPINTTAVAAPGRAAARTGVVVVTRAGVVMASSVRECLPSRHGAPGCRRSGAGTTREHAVTPWSCREIALRL
jgi:hypothetical protein